MKKILAILFAMTVIGFAVSGCSASGEVTVDEPAAEEGE